MFAIKLVLSRVLPLVFFAGLMLVPRPVQANAEDQVEQAVSASKGWVQQIDAGKYEDSYAFACGAMREKVAEDNWVEVLKALRKPWGAVVARQQLSKVYHPNGAYGLNGECVVVTYNTAFKNMEGATEVVVLKWEDGKWRGAGYTAGPTPDANAAPSSTAQSATETHTESHVRAEPK